MPKSTNINATPVTETYTLPSKGKLYGMEETGGEITIRSMTTFEEKMRLGGQGNFWKVLSNILNAVVVSPEGFNAEDLTAFDFLFAMYKMRVVSYGPTYKVQVTCPHCGKSSIVKVDLDDLEVKYLSDDFVEPFQVGPLPRSQDMLTCRLLRIGDFIENERKAKNILRDHPDYVGDPEYILRMISQIVDVNGKGMSPIEIKRYVEQMSAMDSAYFSQAYQKKAEDAGLNLDYTTSCESCGEPIQFALAVNSEFFRPTFDI